MPPTDLTIDRLFDAPALAGATLLSARISADGSRVTYLRGKEQDKDRLDLWEYDVAQRSARVLLDCDAVAALDRLSDEERNRRERQRTAALSGIVEYSVSPSGTAILVPLGGELYYSDLDRSADTTLTRISDGQGFVTDATISPLGGWVAFVRDQNLHVHDLARHEERSLTHDGDGAVKNGMAEFVAQEEMGRSTGYWWSPDDAHIAYARVDETPVKVVHRFEVHADGVATFAQRYPEAGSPNAIVRLGVVSVHDGATIWMDLGPDTDVYIARIDWLPDGKTLAIQRQSRDQRRLDLLFADAATGVSRVVLTECSATWVDLHDELTFLRGKREFVWLSARDGFPHLYLYRCDGRLVRQLTAGDWSVDDFRARAVKAIDESHRWLYFSATAQSPRERHLYRVSLDTPNPRAVQRITQEPGLHCISMSRDAGVYVDILTSSTQPEQVSLHRSDGTLIAYLSQNILDERHPDAPYAADNAIPEFGTLTAEDGQSLHYRIFKPKQMDAERRHPAIVDVYGGPGVQRVLDGWSGAAFTQILTRAGYVVFQLDNRGTAHRGRAFQDGLHGGLGEIEVSDQMQGARWLMAQSFVDPARIGVWGWSYGGYLALMLMCKAPDLFRAGVSGAPVTDWSLYDTHYTERYLGKPQEHPARYARSAVLPYAKHLRGSLLVMHGMADDNVLFTHSTKLFSTLQELRKPFEVMVYPGAKHGLIRQQCGRHAYATMLRFFEDRLRR